MYIINNRTALCFSFLLVYNILISWFPWQGREDKKRGTSGKSDSNVTLHTQLVKYLFNFKDIIIKRQYIKQSVLPKIHN